MVFASQAILAYHAKPEVTSIVWATGTDSQHGYPFFLRMQAKLRKTSSKKKHPPFSSENGAGA